MRQNTANKLLINDVVLDVVGLRVKVHGHWRTIEVKQLALLRLLIENIGQVVSRETIITTLWPDIIVSDNSVSQLVVQLRKTLGDDKNKPLFVKTVPRVGYQLIATVSDAPDFTETLLTPQENRPIYWLLAGLIIGGGVLQITHYLFNKNTLERQYEYQSRLTASPGAEVYLRYSPDGRYLAFSHVGSDQEQFDLSIIDMKTQSLHNLKSTGYSEESPVWSADGKWLAYYRYDPFSCSIRVLSVESTIEMWRLSPESTLMQCDPAQGPMPLFWSQDNQLYMQKWVENDIEIFRYQIEFHNGVHVSKKISYPHHSGLLHDMSRDADAMLFSHSIYGKNQLFSKRNLELADSKRLLSKEFEGPASWGVQQGTYWVGGDTLSLFDMAGNTQNIHTASGVISDIAVDHKHGHVAHSEGVYEVNLYHFDALQTEQQLQLKAVSSAAKLDILGEVSRDGNWFAFASFDQHVEKSDAQVELWVKHRQRPTANLLTMLPNKVFPKQLLFSPKGDNLMIVSDEGDIYLINLFSKKLVTIIQDFHKIKNLYWSDDGRLIYYQAKQSSGMWQSWAYSLSENSNQLLEINSQVASANMPTLAEQNRSFPEFFEGVTRYLLKYTQDEIDPEQLQASLRLYKPALFEKGIYYVLRQGHQLHLYCYYSEQQRNIRLRSLGMYLYDINVPLSLSTDWAGSHVLLNKVDGIETDIVLHHFKSTMQ